MKSETLAITGMSCTNCVDHVTKALSGLNGTDNVHVDLDTKLAILDYDPSILSVADLIAAVDEEGYSAKPVTTPESS
jgi:Cu+-exporting ATPase